jgi:tetratricopeptide (TPR) repeat protein
VKPGFVVIVLLSAVVGLQALREGQQPLARPPGVSGNILYLQSAEVVRRAVLSYDSLAADLYWIRAVQHYGSTKLSSDVNKQYDLLFPLLDLTTSLDPYFNIAYQFGAVFLAEMYPAGAGRPDLAIALLEKGLKSQPARWQFAQDVGFVHYWWRQDYPRAAEWFRRASEMPGAPNWLAAMAAVTLAQGGNRESSRRLWQEVVNNSEEAEWLRTQGEFRLRQLDAMDQIAVLERVIALYRERTRTLPRAWIDLVRAGYLRGIPVDPARVPYVLDPSTGRVGLAPTSTLNPLPAPEQPRG